MRQRRSSPEKAWWRKYWFREGIWNGQSTEPWWCITRLLTLMASYGRLCYRFWWTRRRDCLSSHVYLYHPNISNVSTSIPLNMKNFFFSSRHIIVYAPQTKSPTCFSSFPDNASELPNSCSQISRLEWTIPTASYTVRAFRSGRDDALSHSKQAGH